MAQADLVVWVVVVHSVVLAVAIHSVAPEVASLEWAVAVVALAAVWVVACPVWVAAAEVVWVAEEEAVEVVAAGAAAEPRLHLPNQAETTLFSAPRSRMTARAQNFTILRPSWPWIFSRLLFKIVRPKFSLVSQPQSLSLAKQFQFSQRVSPRLVQAPG